jgi:anti-sigma B factor antagonist
MGVLPVIETEERWRHTNSGEFILIIKAASNQKMSRSDRAEQLNKDEGAAVNQLRGSVMLKIHTRNLGDVAVLSVQGRIVNGETVSLREAVGSEVAARPQTRGRAIVLDLARVSAVDASGLGLMLELRELAQRSGIRLKLANASSFVRRIFEVTRLDSVFELSTAREPPATIHHQQPARVLPFARCA